MIWIIPGLFFCLIGSLLSELMRCRFVSSLFRQEKAGLAAVWSLACVLLTALLFVFMNVNQKNKSINQPLCYSVPLSHFLPRLPGNNLALHA